MDEVKKDQISKKGGPQGNEKAPKIVKNPVKVKKKNKLAKLAESFFVEDIKSVLSWGVTEVAIPALKKLFVEFIDNTANSMMYGHGSGEYQKRRSSVGNISYREFYNTRRNISDAYAMRHTEVYSFGTVEVETKEEAKDVLKHMDANIREYGFITVGHFLQMLDVQPRSTDFNYGWTSISGARIIGIPNGGYEISLPKVMQID